MRRRSVSFLYPAASMVALPGIYLDVKRDDTTHSSMNMNKVYLVLTNWKFPVGEGLMQGTD